MSFISIKTEEQYHCHNPLRAVLSSLDQEGFSLSFFFFSIGILESFGLFVLIKSRSSDVAAKHLYLPLNHQTGPQILKEQLPSESLKSCFRNTDTGLTIFLPILVRSLSFLPYTEGHEIKFTYNFI